MQRIVSVLTIVALVLAFNYLPARADAPPAAGSISGTIVDKDGNAVGAGIEVKLFKHEKHAGKHGEKNQDAGGEKPGHPRPAPLATATTDANGKFTFANLEVGDYLIGARDKGVGRGHAKVAVGDVTAAASVTITLEQGKAAGHGKHAAAT